MLLRPCLIPCLLPFWLSKNIPHELPNLSTSDLNTQCNALCHILETCDWAIDPTSVEGSSGIPNNCNPFAFTAATDNNPDCLSQLQMLRASNQAAFVQVQQPKIDGLQNADIFEYHYMSELANLPAGT